MAQLILIAVLLLSTGLITASESDMYPPSPTPFYWSGAEKLYFQEAKAKYEKGRGEIPSFHSSSQFELLKTYALSKGVNLPFYVYWVQSNEPTSTATNLQQLNRTSCYVTDAKDSTLVPCDNSGKATLLCFRPKRTGCGRVTANGATSNPLEPFLITTFVLSIYWLKVFFSPIFSMYELS